MRRIIVRITPMTVAIFGLAFASLGASGQAADDARSRKLMEEAFNRRYRWSENFKGFSADFTLTREGKTVKGSLQADVTKPHGGVSVACDDVEVKKLVQDTVASTVTHTRATSFDTAFELCSFTNGGEGPNGGTRIIVSGHGFFKDFTVKDGHFVENHGGHGEMSSEVKVHQVVWVAETSKTLPREYSFTIKTGDREQTGKTTETWRDVDGVWLPAWYRLTRSEGSSPVESSLHLENVKVTRGTS
jgi:hypothetical protein